MKKKLLLCFLILLFICGCSNDNTLKSKNDFSYDIEQIGAYKNISFEKVDIEISEVEMQDEIEASLMQYSTFEEVEKRGIKEGDIVYLRYSTINNNEISEENSCEIIVGDGDFDIKFEKELVGKIAKEDYKFSITFDNTCTYDEWKNKEIKFSVYIDKIEETVFPELTESFLKEKFDLNTVDEYNEYIKKIIYNNKIESNKVLICESVMKEIIKETVFGISFEKRCMQRFDEVIDSYQKYADLNGILLSDVLSTYDMTEEELYDIAKYNEACSQICQYIIEKEKLLPSSDEIKSLKQLYVEEYGYDTIDEFVLDNGEEYLSECIYNEIGLEYIYKNINFY